MKRFIALTCLLVMFMFSCAWASEEVAGEILPFSQEFLKWQEEQDRNPDSADHTGIIPFPVDLTHLADNPPQPVYQDVPDRKASTLPAKYDLRSYNYVTSVKKQSPYNTCWAFSSIGAMESNYLKNTGTTLDLSEMHVAWYSFKNSNPALAFYDMNSSTSNDVLEHGGNSFYVTALYSRLAGPVSETEVPYTAQPSKSQPEDYTRLLMLRDVYYIARGDETSINTSTSTRDIIKQRIIDNGAVVANYHSNNSSYNKTPSRGTAYYYNNKTTNHAVLLVGWDDTYSKDNFKTKPNKDGAWLVKNSWGDKWWNGSENVGDDGYFWMSYSQFLSEGSAFIVEAADSTMQAYYYDALGWCGTYGSTTQKQMYAANVFQSNRSGENLTDVGFFTHDNNMTYEIIIYTGLGSSMPSNPAPSNKTPVLTQSGTIPFAGYHTIKLDDSIALTQGEYFSVIVKYGSGTAPVEMASGNYSKNATIEPGSFFSSNGTSWTAGTSIQANACVKAFTTGTASAGRAPTISTTSLNEGVVNESYSATINASGTRPITWTTSGNVPTGLSINESTGVLSGTPTTAGNYTFSVTATNSQGSDSKSYTVNIYILPTLKTTSFDAYAGYAFSETLKLSQNISATWTAGTKLPAGLKLDASTGDITGKPTKAGTYTIAFTASTSIGNVTGNVIFRIAAKPVKPKISTSSLAAGTVDTEYSQALKISGTEPISLTAEGLPDGLDITAAGNITGTPEVTGTFTVKITAENIATELEDNPVTKNVKITIKAKAPVIETPDDLENAVVDEAYDEVQFTTSSGTEPIKWTASGLPSGMTLSTTGLLSGTPKGNPKDYTITIKATNTGGTSAIKVPLKVLMKPVLTTTKLAYATTDKKYSAKLTAKGTTPITWTIDELPDTMSFKQDSKGTTATISGTPVEIETYALAITLENEAGETETSVDLTVKGVAAKLTASLAKGTAGKEYTGSKISTTGTKPITITYSISDKDKEKFGINDLEDLGFEFEADEDNGTATITGTPEKSIKSLPITISAINSAMTSPVSKKVNLTITGTKPVFTTPTDNTINIIAETGTNVEELDDEITFEVTGTPDIVFSMNKVSGFYLESEDNTATLKGTLPEKDGKTTITVSAANADGKASKKVIIQAMTPPTITTESLKDGKLKKGYSAKVTATGTKALKWSIDGDLPSGVKFANGSFSGTPKEAGEFYVTVKVSNAIGEDEKDFTIYIEDPNEDNGALPADVSAPAPESVSEESVTAKSDENADVPGITFGEVRSVASLSAGVREVLEGEGYTIAAVLPEIAVEKSGLYDLEAVLGEYVQTGAKLYWFAYPEDGHESDDDAIVEFYDSDGAEIETVPEDRNIIVSAWLTEGVIYAPVIAVK